MRHHFPGPLPFTPDAQQTRLEGRRDRQFQMGVGQGLEDRQRLSQRLFGLIEILFEEMEATDFHRGAAHIQMSRRKERGQLGLGFPERGFGFVPAPHLAQQNAGENLQFGERRPARVPRARLPNCERLLDAGQGRLEGALHGLGNRLNAQRAALQGAIVCVPASQVVPDRRGLGAGARNVCLAQVELGYEQGARARRGLRSPALRGE